MVSGAELGVLGGLLLDVYVKIVPVKGRKALFGRETEIPVRPMIGVIGVAPAKEEINTERPADTAEIWTIPWSEIESAEDIEDAVQHTTENIFYFQKDRLALMEGEIAMLMILAGQLQFWQVVDPLKTVRFIMPKQYIVELTL